MRESVLLNLGQQEDGLLGICLVMQSRTVANTPGALPEHGDFARLGKPFAILMLLPEAYEGSASNSKLHPNPLS